MQGSIGRICFTGADDLFFLDDGALRRLQLNPRTIARFAIGDSFRNWAHENAHCVCPYDDRGKRLAGSNVLPIRSYLHCWRRYLENRLSYRQAQAERGLKWWEYSIAFPDRIKAGPAICLCEIATHLHAEVVQKPFIANRANPILHLADCPAEGAFHLCVAHMNSSCALFWLKQVCFSKRESAEAAKDTYYEFAGGKVEQLPVPEPIAQALKGKGLVRDQSVPDHIPWAVPWDDLAKRKVKVPARVKRILPTDQAGDTEQRTDRLVRPGSIRRRRGGGRGVTSPPKQIVIVKIVLPPDVGGGRKLLENMNISAAMLFPTLGGLARSTHQLLA